MDVTDFARVLSKSRNCCNKLALGKALNDSNGQSIVGKE